MASAEDLANCSGPAEEEASFWPNRSSAWPASGWRLSYEPPQTPPQQKKSHQSLHVGIEAVGEARSSHVDIELAPREVKALSLDAETRESLPLKFGTESSSGQEALSCASENVTGGVIGISPEEQIDPEMDGGVTQLGISVEIPREVTSSIQEGAREGALKVVREIPLGSKEQLVEQSKVSFESVKRSLESFFQERQHPVDPSGTAPKERNESFHGRAKTIKRGNELHLGEENVHSGEKLGGRVEYADEDLSPLNQRHALETAAGRELPINEFQNTILEEAPTLGPKQRTVKDCIKAFEREPQPVSKDTILDCGQYNSSERSTGQKRRNQSFDVAVEKFVGGKRFDCCLVPSGIISSGVLETTGATAINLGLVGQPDDTSGGSIATASRGTQLNGDLEAAEIASRVSGKTVKAFIGALEALSRETAVQSTALHKRVSHDSPMQAPRERVRIHSLRPDTANEGQEATYDFVVKNSGPDRIPKECPKKTSPLDTPLSRNVKVNRRVPSLNANCEATQVSNHLSIRDEFPDGSHTSNLEERATRSGFDSGASKHLSISDEFPDGSHTSNLEASATRSGFDSGACENLSTSDEFPDGTHTSNLEESATKSGFDSGASKHLSISDELPDGSHTSNLEVSANRSGFDSRAGELMPLRLSSEALQRNVAYVGLGVDTGARGVTPLSLGIATAGGVMEVLIPRNTPIPTKKAVIFSTFVDDQTEVHIQIFEGERFRTVDNKLLGTFELSGIAPAPRGVAHICVSFEIDAKGILNVFVKDRSTGTRKSVTIITDIGSLSEEVVEDMIEDGEKNRLEDEIHKSRIDAKNSLEAYAYQVRDLVSDEEVCRNISPSDKEKIDGAVESVINWLLYKSWLFHCYNQLDEVAVFDQKHVELKSICNPILESVYQQATSPRST